MTLSELFLHAAQRLHDKKCNYICYGLYDIGHANVDDTELNELIDKATGIITERLEDHLYLTGWMMKNHPDLYYQDPGKREDMMRQTRINWCLSLAEEFKEQ